VVTGADSGFEGRVILELADLSRLRVEAAINEIDVASLALGQEVEISFESAPDLEARGRVTFIAPAAGKSADGVTSTKVKEREYPVQIAIEGADARIRPGMTARVRIETGRAERAVALPATVVFHDFEKDESHVFVRAAAEAGPEAAPVRRQVELGLRDEDWVEIRSGLKVGEEVSRQRVGPNPNRQSAAEKRAQGDED
jgi:multidrug efflux pump subunit AcrA (membrane-fusion protein)